jgi:hypothetical protein
MPTQPKTPPADLLTLMMQIGERFGRLEERMDAVEKIAAPTQQVDGMDPAILAVIRTQASSDKALYRHLLTEAHDLVDKGVKPADVVHAIRTGTR